MIIYNVTVNVEPHIAEAWLQWLLNEHIPEVLQTKCFTNYKVARLLEVDDSEGPTYIVQYYAETKTEYNRYIELYAPEMRKRTFDKWGDHFISFRSVLEVVQ